MKIKVLFFGSCREAAGAGDIELELSDTAVAGDAWTSTMRLFPSLSRFERSILLAVNEEHARKETKLKDGDTVAIFPPVSGG